MPNGGKFNSAVGKSKVSGSGSKAEEDQRLVILFCAGLGLVGFWVAPFIAHYPAMKALADSSTFAIFGGMSNSMYAITGNIAGELIPAVVILIWLGHVKRYHPFLALPILSFVLYTLYFFIRDTSLLAGVPQGQIQSWLSLIYLLV